MADEWSDIAGQISPWESGPNEVYFILSLHGPKFVKAGLNLGLRPANE